MSWNASGKNTKRNVFQITDVSERYNGIFILELSGEMFVQRPAGDEAKTPESLPTRSFVVVGIDFSQVPSRAADVVMPEVRDKRLRLARFHRSHVAGIAIGSSNPATRGNDVQRRGREGNVKHVQHRATHTYLQLSNRYGTSSCKNPRQNQFFCMTQIKNQR